ncbi:MAG: hypothetical protein QXF56_00470 [Candidatus Micrarchaeia archaeon]
MRKGFFFTLLIFIFFFLVLISVTAWTRIRESQEEQVVVSMRINKMNEFAQMIREDAERTTLLCGANALRTAAAYVAYNNESKFLNNAKCFDRNCIYELMYNATLGGKENYTKMDGNNVSFSSPDHMGNLTLKEWDARMIQLGEKAGFNVSIYRDNIGIYQSDPWNVKIGYNLHLNITDKSLDSVFRRDLTPILVTIPLTNYTYGG